MSDSDFLITIPVETWAPEHYVPAAARNAAELLNELRSTGTSVDEVIITAGHLIPIRPVAFELSARFTWRCSPRDLTTSVQVNATVLGPDDAVLASISIRTVTRWESALPITVTDDVGQTFALAFGYLDPITQATRALRHALRTLSIRAEVRRSSRLVQNRMAVLETSSQPPMSSNEASPFTPYGVAGIPGLEAEHWAGLGFPASSAAPWFKAGYDAESAVEWAHCGWTAEEGAPWFAAGFEPSAPDEWIEGGWSPEEAAPWYALGFLAEDAADCEGIGATPEMVITASALNINIDDFADMSGAVPPEEMGPWLNAIEDLDLLSPGDVESFVEAGLSALDLYGAPRDLTAGELVRYLTDDEALDFDGHYLALEDDDEHDGEHDPEDEDEGNREEPWYLRR